MNVTQHQYRVFKSTHSDEIMTQRNQYTDVIFDAPNRTETYPWHWYAYVNDLYNEMGYTSDNETVENAKICARLNGYAAYMGMCHVAVYNRTLDRHK